MKCILLLAMTLASCETCPNVDETAPILPPANGDAAPFELPSRTGDLPHDECAKWCDAGSIVSCSFDEPGDLPTVHCVVSPVCE